MQNDENLRNQIKEMQKRIDLMTETAELLRFNYSVYKQKINRLQQDYPERLENLYYDFEVAEQAQYEKTFSDFELAMFN